MVVTGGASTSGGKTSKPNKQGKGSKGKQREEGPSSLLPMCREKHIMKNCPQWQAVLEATKNVEKRDTLDPTIHDVRHPSEYGGEFSGGQYRTGS